jgi:hypothetical protein
VMVNEAIVTSTEKRASTGILPPMINQVGLPFEKPAPNPASRVPSRQSFVHRKTPPLDGAVTKRAPRRSARSMGLVRLRAGRQRVHRCRGGIAAHGVSDDDQPSVVLSPTRLVPYEPIAPLGNVAKAFCVQAGEDEGQVLLAQWRRTILPWHPGGRFVGYALESLGCVRPAAPG